MTIQALARTLRPQSFLEVIGQDGTVGILENSFKQNRLHHAYLFTGTRGVGKTTISRLLAKSLNCEIGQAFNPCHECMACREISAGRHHDLVEIDAASHSKVEEIRQMLENVQYMPNKGRYKIYLIDEVHMLSTSSFNALLKTLEEPPAHVKFILATTEVKKLPVTILSRCLQLQLKNVPVNTIAKHLSSILKKENISYDDNALFLLAEAANGSIRDSLSLLDKAIPSCENNHLSELLVAGILSGVTLSARYELVDAILNGDFKKSYKCSCDITAYDPDYLALITSIKNTLHKIALSQTIEGLFSNDHDYKYISAMGLSFQPNHVWQLHKETLTSIVTLSSLGCDEATFNMLLIQLCQTKGTSTLDSAKEPATTAQSPTINPSPLIQHHSELTPSHWDAAKNLLAVDTPLELACQNSTLMTAVQQGIEIGMSSQYFSAINQNTYSMLSDAINKHFGMVIPLKITEVA